MAGLLWPLDPNIHTITQGFNGDNPAERPGYLETDNIMPKRAKLTSFAGGIYHTHLHGALDFACPIGTPLIAPEAGLVVAEGTYASTGEHYLMIRFHKDATQQTVAFYTHLSKIIYPVGTHVTRGEKVALSGNSGMSTGPHLHYEIRLGAVTSDPHLSSAWFKWNPRRLVVGADLAGSPWLLPS